MCCTTQRSEPLSCSSCAYCTMRSNARLAVRTRSTGVISYSSDRIGLIFRVPPCRDGLLVGSATRGGGGGEHDHREAAARGFAVDHLNALAQPTLGQQAVGLARGLARARDAAGEVNRHDVLSGLEQRLPHG